MLELEVCAVVPGFYRRYCIHGLQDSDRWRAVRRSWEITGGLFPEGLADKLLRDLEN